MACISELEQNPDHTWAGRVFPTGEVRQFQTLDDYKQYTKSLEVQGTFCPNIDYKYADPSRPGQYSTSTGFMEFRPRDPAAQARYSAMSPSWEGIESSEAAIARGEYDLDAAEKNRQNLRAKGPPPKPETPKPIETSRNCSIQ